MRQAQNKERLRFVLRVLLIWAFEVVGLLFIAWLLPGVRVGSLLAAVGAVAAIGVLNALLWPLLSYLILPFAVLTLGLLSLVLNAGLVLLASNFVTGFQAHGPVAIGARGRHYLSADRLEGEDPLIAFGPNAAAHLCRTDAFPDAPDILVNSFYDPEMEQVAASEELIGSHGGLGGWQTQPFLMFPAVLNPPEVPIVGAASLHAVLKGWLGTAIAMEESEP